MSELITADRRMKDLIQLAKTVAQSKATVLIQGESGTGKEIMASLIHEQSNRALKSFVAINCATIPENLLESELFGYERGAFTGAVSSKAGKFEFANGGTLLLSEISEMDVRLQAKLLHVIQESEVDRIGGRRPIAIDVRIIATTNKNLSECVKKGSFREDLFSRLNVVNLTIPPLRERIGDVRILADHFGAVYANRNGRMPAEIAEDAFMKLDAHVWPGNVRELEQVMERAVITSASSVLSSSDIFLERKSENLMSQNSVSMEASVLSTDNEDMNGWAPGRTLDDIERRVIIEALSYHQGNRTHTARSLGISIRTLRNKLADYRRLGLNL